MYRSDLNAAVCHGSSYLLHSDNAECLKSIGNTGIIGADIDALNEGSVD